MGPRLSSWNFSSVDRCPKIAGAREELSPAQIRDKETGNLWLLEGRDN